MSQLSEFLEAQTDIHADGFPDATKSEICNDVDSRSILTTIALTFSALAIKRFAEEEFNPLNLLQTTASAINAGFNLGFEMGIRWAETKALEAEHA